MHTTFFSLARSVEKEVFQLDHQRPIFKSFTVYCLSITVTFGRSQDSSVGVVTGPRAGRPETGSIAETVKGFISFQSVQTGCETHPVPVVLSVGTGTSCETHTVPVGTGAVSADICRAT
jgi:hypothetical protein